MITFGIVELYCGASGKTGFYNSQEVGLARAMKKLGYKCCIFYPAVRGTTLTEEPVEEDIIIIRCPAKSIGVHSHYDWSVLTEYHVDVALVYADNQIFAPNLIQYCDTHAIRICSYNGVAGSNSTNPLIKFIMDQLFDRNVRTFAKHKTFAKTQSVKNNLEKSGLQNVEVIPVGLDTVVIPEIHETKEELRTICNLPVDKTILLFVGRIDTYKHPEEMLELLKDLPDNYYGVMIGDGALSKQTEETIKAESLSNRLKWIRILPNEEVHQYYRTADYFLNFNTGEIFGMAILEAMYQGCTVIAKHAPGPDTIIENGISGYLVDDQYQMRKSVVDGRILEKESVKKRITDFFTWDRTASVINEWINKKTNY